MNSYTATFYTSDFPFHLAHTSRNLAFAVLTLHVAYTLQCFAFTDSSWHKVRILQSFVPLFSGSHIEKAYYRIVL